MLITLALARKNLQYRLDSVLAPTRRFLFFSMRGTSLALSANKRAEVRCEEMHANNVLKAVTSQFFFNGSVVLNNSTSFHSWCANLSAITLKQLV